MMSERMSDVRRYGLDGVPFPGITDKVEADADVLGALMELRVFLQVGLHLGCRRGFAGAR